MEKVSAIEFTYSHPDFYYGTQVDIKFEDAILYMDSYSKYYSLPYDISKEYFNQIIYTDLVQIFDYPEHIKNIVQTLTDKYFIAMEECNFKEEFEWILQYYPTLDKEIIYWIQNVVDKETPAIEDEYSFDFACYCEDNNSKQAIENFKKSKENACCGGYHSWTAKDPNGKMWHFTFNTCN